MQIRTRSQRKTASGTPAVVAAEAAPQSPAKRARRGKHAGEAAVEPSSDSAPAAAPAAEPASPPKQRTRPIAASTPSRSEKRHGLLEAAAVGAAAAAASAAVTAAAAAADADAPNTPRTPRTPHRAQTPRTPRTPASVYLEAKSVFHRCATPSRLVGRDAERRAIRRFIEIHALEGVPGSLYISGYPGTGKTALLDEVCRNMAAEMKSAARKVTLVKLNCMNFTQAGSIFAGLLQAATGETVPAKSGLKSLEQVIMPGSKCSGDKEAGNSFFLFILDELDQLISRDQEALYQLFTWARAPHGRMALIGISNAMDLTTRFLPRLRAKDCEPQLLNFDVYKVTEIAAIIKDRLLMIGAGDGGDMHEVDGHVPSTPSRKRTHDEISGPEIAAPAAPGGVGDHRVGLTLIQPMAIEMAARKIVDTGDVRKALDVCRCV
nr:AAA ATPase [Polyrhizophydium stewartii]